MERYPLRSDSANEAGNYADTTGYVPANNPIRPFFATTEEEIEYPGKSQPLTYLNDTIQPATPSYIAPHWGNVIPFALTSSDQFRPLPPQPLKPNNIGTEHYRKQSQRKLEPNK